MGAGMSTVKAALDRHCISGANMPPQGAGQTLPELMILCFSCGWMRASEYHDHVAEVIAALMPEASESVEWVAESVDPEWCYSENCRHRHWRSGSMPTHRLGADCPSEVAE